MLHEHYSLSFDAIDQSKQAHLSWQASTQPEGGLGVVYRGRINRSGSPLRDAALKVVDITESDNGLCPFNQSASGSRFGATLDSRYWAPVLYDGLVDAGLIMQALNDEGVPGIPYVDGVYEPFDRKSFINPKNPLYGKVVMAMEYIEGADLRDKIIKRHGKFTLPEVISVLDKIAPTVDRMHSASKQTGRDAVVHLDIKPENFRISNKGQPYLLDFDSATQVRDLPAQMQLFYENKTPLTTDAYLAPECYLQAVREFNDGENMRIGIQTDMYAIAIIALEMLTGKTLQEFAQSRSITFDKFEKHEEVYSYLKYDFLIDVNKLLKERGFSKEVRDAFSKALSFHPQDRYSTVKDFANELRRTLGIKERMQLYLIRSLAKLMMCIRCINT